MLAGSARSSRRSQRGSISSQTALLIVGLGILLRVASPLSAEAMESAVSAKGLADARHAITTCSAASAAGLDFVDYDDDVEKTLIDLSIGGFVERGGCKGAFFQLYLTEREISYAAPYLEIVDGVLRLKKG